MTVPGDLFAGRYRLVRRVATGGMGSVWEGWDELLQRRVAIKELLLQPALQMEEAEMARSRVVREARITARLHHPHAVTLYDVIDHGGQPCLVLQYVPSRTLGAMLAEQGSLPPQFVTRVGAEIASALAAAHQVGIVHRDVKPSNVLITPAGAALITDFGIAHATGDVSLTSTGMVSGTPAFLAPEVARGARSGFSADVFSLGATVYAALEGTPPFGAEQNAMAILHKVASGQIIPPRRSGELTSLLGQMLAPDPAARPVMSTVARLLADHAFQQPASRPAPQTVAVPPPTVREWPADGDRSNATAFTADPEPAVPVALSRVPGRRHRRAPVGMLAAAAAVLLLVGLGAWLLVGQGRTQQAAGNNIATSSAAANHATGSRLSAAPPVPATSRSAATASRPVAPPPPTTPSTRAGTSSPATSPSTTSSSTTSRSTTSSSTRATTSAAGAGAGAGASSSSATGGPPTSAQLAAAITDYYALLPGDTDQGWAHLTENFQTGTAQNRPYYQRFWDSVGRVTASGARGASPDTAEATITYYFKDGRTVVEPTVYSLVRQGGLLKIDSSTVLESTTQ